MKNWQKRLLALLIIVLAIMALLWLKNTRSKPVAKATAETIRYIDVIHVQTQNQQPQLNVLASVSARFHSELGSAISSEVEGVLVKAGDWVTQGQLLLRLDAERVKLRVIQRLSAIQDIQAQIQMEKIRYTANQKAMVFEQKLQALANQALQREQQLKQQKMISAALLDNTRKNLAQQLLSLNQRQQLLDEHPARLQQLRASLAKARALHQEALKDEQDTQIRAPFDGWVSSVKVAPGDRVREGEKLLSLYDASSLEVRAMLPEKYIRMIVSRMSGKQTSKKQLSDDAIFATAKVAGQPLMLVLDRLSAQITGRQLGREGIFVPVATENSQNLLPGQQLALQISLPELKDVQLIPLSTLYQERYVYRVRNSRLQRINVVLRGIRFTASGTSLALITATELLPDDRLLFTHLADALDGLHVTIRNTLNAL